MLDLIPELMNPKDLFGMGTYSMATQTEPGKHTVPITD